MSGQEWRLRAACRGADSSDAFGTAAEQELFIARYCRDCPVKRECGTFGMVTGADGVYGGTTARQRRARLKVAPVKVGGGRQYPCGTNAAYSRHLKNGEKPCAACKAAKADYARGWYQSKRRPA